MTVPRIILKEALTDGQLVTLREEQFTYLARVNRIKSHEKFFCLDSAGREYLCETVSVGRKELSAYAYLLKDMDAAADTLELCFGILKGEKNEFLIKAGTQLGVTAFTPLQMERSVVRLKGGKAGDRTERFQRIAEEAARTSFLNYVPEVRAITFPDRLEPRQDALLLLFSERKGLPLLPAFEAGIRKTPVVQAVFGPEGGIADDEFRLFEKRGFLPVSLGERALKAEFAVLAALSVIIYLKKGAF